MLKFYSRTLAARNTEQLVSVAEDITKYYRSRARVSLEENPTSYQSSLFCVQQEMATFLHWLADLPDTTKDVKFGMLEAGVTTSQVLTHLLQEKEKTMLLRTIITCVIGHLPLKKVIDEMFTQSGISPEQHTKAKLLVFAFLQVILINVGHGKKNFLNPITMILNTGCTAGVLGMAHWIHMRLIRFPIPRWCQSICAIIAIQALSPVTQRVVRFGIKSTIEWLTEKSMSAAFRTMEKRLPELPITVDTAPELECLICHDVMSDPVEIMGSFCCRNCLKNWMLRSSVHPLTGVDISPEMVTESVLMSHVVYKYKIFLLRDLEKDKKDL